MKPVRAASSDEGASLVEFAVVVMLLFTLVMGVIDFGMTFSNWQAVRHGSRAGARAAIVSTFGTDTSCPQAPLSGPASTETVSLICLTKDQVGLDAADTRVKIAFGSGGYVEGEPLVVCVQYPVTSITGFFEPLLNNRTSESEVQMRIEEIETTGVLDAVEEEPLPGSGWAQCTVT